MDPYAATERLERSPEVDDLVARLDRRIPAALRTEPWRGRLAGTWLGHALHPLLTDFPLGMWMSATVLDLVGGADARRASTTLTGLGLVAAVPTAAAGAVEWLDASPDQRRVGAVHAVVNSAATTLYLASFAAKLAGRRRTGTLAAVAGGLAATVGGYLGGHLSFARGVGVDRTLHQREHERPSEVVLIDDGRAALRADEGRYLVLTAADATIAVPDRCTRCGGRLAEASGALACRADGSRFAATAGTVERGPATTPLPRFTVVGDGHRRTLHPYPPERRVAGSSP